MSLLTFIQSAFGGTAARVSDQNARNAAAEALEEGSPSLLDRAQDVASDVWDTINPLRAGKAASDLLDREVEGAGKLLGLGLGTAQEAAQAGQELGKAGQEWGKGSQEAARAASTWSTSAVQLALVGAGALLLAMWLRQPPAGGTP